MTLSRSQVDRDKGNCVLGDIIEGDIDVEAPPPVCPILPALNGTDKSGVLDILLVLPAEVAELLVESRL